MNQDINHLTIDEINAKIVDIEALLLSDEIGKERKKNMRAEMARLKTCAKSKKQKYHNETMKYIAQKKLALQKLAELREKEKDRIFIRIVSGYLPKFVRRILWEKVEAMMLEHDKENGVNAE